MQTRNCPSISSLHRLAQEAHIENFSSYSKPMLYSKLKDQFNLDRLQRAAFRSRRKRGMCDDSDDHSMHLEGIVSSPSSSSPSLSCSSFIPASLPVENKSKRKKSTTTNALDPILFVPIQKSKTFRFLRPNGTEVLFNIESLVDYILKTGNFNDPETRLAFSDDDLLKMDKLIKKLGLQKPSVYEAKQNPQRYHDRNFRRDALLGLERCAGDVITEILNIIENCDTEEAQMRLFLREFPLFADFYQQLKDADSEFAKQCLVHWRNYLIGPPNRPIPDIYGLVGMTLSFLSELE